MLCKVQTIWQVIRLEIIRKTTSKSEIIWLEIASENSVNVCWCIKLKCIYLFAPIFSLTQFVENARKPLKER